MSTEPAIVLAKSVTRVFGTGEAARRAVDDVSLSVQKGEVVLIFGPSGCGKSTLLALLGGLDRAYSGSLELFGRDVSRLSDTELSQLRGERIGFVFQAFHLLGHLSVLENVMAPALFSRDERSVETRAREVLERVGQIQLELPDLLEELERCLGSAPDATDLSFPFVLSAGERRSFTANTLLRDPAWRNKDAAGALRICPSDASALGVATGAELRLTTRRGTALVTVEVSDTMQPGHVSLPNGLGTSYGDERPGVAPNELTSLDERDPFVGTPWHKHVRARLERV